MTADLNNAIALAVKAHKGQIDKAGANYILHPLRVMMRCETENEMMAAILHDVVEDSECSLEDLREMNFPAEVIAAVECLSQKKGEDYFKFIGRCVSNEIARKVKLLDLKDNLDVTRLNKWSLGATLRTANYFKAYKMLKETEGKV